MIEIQSFFVKKTSANSAIAEKPTRRHVASRSMHCLRDICLWNIGNWGCSHSRSSKVLPFDSLSMVSYSASIATMAVSRTVSEIHRLICQKSPNFLTLSYLAKLGVKLSELSNDRQCQKTRMMGLSGGKRISTKSLAILTQSTCVTYRHRDRW